MSKPRVSRTKIAGAIAAAITTAIIGAFASGAVSLPPAKQTVSEVETSVHQIRLIQQHDTMILLMQHICLNTAPDASARRACLNKRD